MDGRFVAYYRVSTVKQGQSGLGLDAQRSAVENYLNGGNWQLVGDFVEIESGKRKIRPQLDAALAICKKQKATLIIAKLDRLARNLHFISGLLEAGVEFLAVDNPTANRLTVQILAAVAEEEARAISARTKAALASAKARGVLLGKHGSKLGGENRQRAQSNALGLQDTIKEIQSEGIVAVRDIATTLNDRGIATPNGKRWHSTSVFRLLKRLEALG